MSKPLQWVVGISILIVALTVAAVGYSASWALHQWGEAAPTATLAKVNTVLDGINPVISKADTAFGNLADATGDWSDSSKQQARDVRALLAASGRAVDAMTEDAQAARGTLNAFTGTANALTGTANGATETLAEGKRTVAAAQPLMAAYTATGYDLHRILTRKEIGEILDHAAGTIGHIDAMTGDGQRVGDDLTRRYFTPEPWWKKIGPFAEAGANLTNKTIGLW